ncbi:MAG: HIT family protein [Sphaerochaetaceae bacterium]|jgi:diadenosine tetraphosphate (Ap4A) HIT family hydrolase|nr:HIT family protein [Sphaerochaetaceae bacterium]
MHTKNADCLFCTVPFEQVIGENRWAFAIWDAFPVTPYHALIIPKRHIADYSNLNALEIRDCHELLTQVKREVEKRDARVDGFNIGVNIGRSAGQTIFHCHIHLIPRRKGDVLNPKGGVRHVVPGQGFYE